MFDASFRNLELLELQRCKENPVVRNEPFDRLCDLNDPVEQFDPFVILHSKATRILFS